VNVEQQMRSERDDWHPANHYARVDITDRWHMGMEHWYYDGPRDTWACLWCSSTICVWCYYVHTKSAHVERLALTYDSIERAREKQASRDEDESALPSGEKTREQLRAENGHFAGLRVRVNLPEPKRLA
jgi:hypothetical protein